MAVKREDILNHSEPDLATGTVVTLPRGMKTLAIGMTFEIEKRK